MTNKRLFIAIINLFLMISVSADNKNLEKDVTMISYEQGWLDSKGTLALRNNTEDEINSITFQITYLDMSGKPLDYEDFMRDVSIAPGMTKKIDIPAYEHSRNYHYYKSENMPGGSPAFKIRFQLKDYNGDNEAIEVDRNTVYDNIIESSTITDSKEQTLYILLAIGVVLLFIGISIGLYVLIAVMAKQRNRNVVAWILLSLLATPLLMIIILLCIGKNEVYISEQ